MSQRTESTDMRTDEDPLFEPRREPPAADSRYRRPSPAELSHTAALERSGSYLKLPASRAD